MSRLLIFLSAVLQSVITEVSTDPKARRTVIIIAHR